MSYTQTLLADFEIISPKYTSSIEFNNPLFITKLQNSWTFFNDTINIFLTIQNHPKYDPSGSGSKELLYLTNNSANVNITSFNSINLNNMYKLIYNKIALLNYHKINVNTYKDNVLNNIQSNYINNIISDNNNFSNNLSHFVPIFNSYNISISDKFYLLTQSEYNFIKFIISVINYFINLINIDQISLTTFFEQTIEETAIQQLFYNIYNINITDNEFKTLVNYLFDICNFILPYIPIFNNNLPSYSIPNYYLGLCVFDYLRENKLTTLIQIALIYNICPTNSHLLTKT